MCFSNQLAGLCLCLLCASAPPASADELKLDAGRVQLSGDILSIKQGGIIELVSPLSKKPLKLRSETLNEAVFSGEAAAGAPAPITLQLINGDTLPVHQILELKDQQLQTKSEIAGLVSIPYQALDSAQFGVATLQNTQANTQNLDEWLDEENEGRNWEYKAKTLIANGSARASQQFDLPKNFVISFKLSWNEKNPPAFRLLFAQDKPSSTGNNQYRLNFSHSGLQLERETARSKRPHTLVQPRRMPAQYAKNEVTFEIRVHRESRRIELLIDGEPESSCIDPIVETPQGSFITIECNGNSGSVQRISNFSIAELTNSHARHLAEGRGDSETDILITADDDRLAGRLLAINPSPEGNILRFQSEFLDHPLEIPQSEVATILFAKPKAQDAKGSDEKEPKVEDPKAEEPKKAASSPFQIKLRNQGLLQIDQLDMANGQVSALHPLLGRISINRQNIQSILRTTP